MFPKEPWPNGARPGNAARNNSFPTQRFSIGQHELGAESLAKICALTDLARANAGPGERLTK
jgi:hypothetical protein